MTMLKPLADNYNYYPRTMIRLCEISYQKFPDIPAAVQGLGLELVWGPAELRSIFDVSYSLMFICRNSQTDEYTVVVRGTNMDSVESWFMEDFDIDTTQPFVRLAPHAPANALIAQGTFNGMKDLLKLTDPSTSLGAVPFLQSAKPTYLYVTGHSLGGTLSPPMFACLNDLLYGGGFVHNMALWTFAGLTPGASGFNTYFNGLFNPEYQWRLHNTLDIAPFCWWSPSDIESIYQSYGLKSGWLDDEAIKHLFVDAAKIGYAQPVGEQALAGVFNKSILDDDLWVAQAAHQHASATYRTLVDQAFPMP
ncbi:MAG: hypothetical protein AABP62_27205 [Planctomycetota bacterium]